MNEFEYDGGIIFYTLCLSVVCLWVCGSFMFVYLLSQRDHQLQGAGVVVEGEGEGLELHPV